MKVSNDILDILAKAIISDNSLELVGELDRATNGYLEDLPEKSFKEAGTNVNTLLIVLEKK